MPETVAFDWVSLINKILPVLLREIPVLAPYADMITNLVIEAEKLFGVGHGSEKMAHVLAGLPSGMLDPLTVTRKVSTAVALANALVPRTSGQGDGSGH